MLVASNGSRKSSHTDVDDVSSVEADATVEKPAPVKMIPAPPPKENAWEKRKTIAAQQQTPVVGANAPAETVKQPEVVDPKEEIPKEETVAAKVSKAQNYFTFLFIFMTSYCPMSVAVLGFITKESFAAQLSVYMRQGVVLTEKPYKVVILVQLIVH